MRRMSRARAPIVRRMPISRVRSSTLIVRVFGEAGHADRDDQEPEHGDRGRERASLAISFGELDVLDLAADVVAVRRQRVFDPASWCGRSACGRARWCGPSSRWRRPGRPAGGRAWWSAARRARFRSPAGLIEMPITRSSTGPEAVWTGDLVAEPGARGAGDVVLDDGDARSRPLLGGRVPAPGADAVVEHRRLTDGPHDGVLAGELDVGDERGLDGGHAGGGADQACRLRVERPASRRGRTRCRRSAGTSPGARGRR